MKKAAFAVVPLLLLLAVALGACGKSAASSSGGSAPAAGNSVTMSATNFDQHTITIKAGDTVTFDDANGAFHQICLGKDMVCDKTAKGPQDVQGDGFPINPGEKKPITFAEVGTYAITCSVHPNMNVVVTVQ